MRVKVAARYHECDFQYVINMTKADDILHGILFGGRRLPRRTTAFRIVYPLFVGRDVRRYSETSRSDRERLLNVYIEGWDRNATRRYASLILFHDFSEIYEQEFMRDVQQDWELWRRSF